jgi:hypothetical protein
MAQLIAREAGVSRQVSARAVYIGGRPAAVPGRWDFDRSVPMMLGYVDSAIVRVRAISEAETQFARAHPQSGYTCTLPELPRNEGIARVVVQGYIDSGYAFEIVGCEKTEVGKPNSTYHITARPLHSGQPAFCSDPSGVLRSDESGSVQRCIAKGVPLGRWRNIPSALPVTARLSVDRPTVFTERKCLRTTVDSLPAQYEISKGFVYPSGHQKLECTSSLDWKQFRPNPVDVLTSLSGGWQV